MALVRGVGLLYFVKRDVLLFFLPCQDKKMALLLCLRPLCVIFAFVMPILFCQVGLYKRIYYGKERYRLGG